MLAYATAPMRLVFGNCVMPNLLVSHWQNFIINRYRTWRSQCRLAFGIALGRLFQFLMKVSVYIVTRM